MSTLLYASAESPNKDHFKAKYKNNTQGSSVSCTILSASSTDKFDKVKIDGKFTYGSISASIAVAVSISGASGVGNVTCKMNGDSKYSKENSKKFVRYGCKSEEKTITVETEYPNGNPGDPVKVTVWFECVNANQSYVGEVE